MAGKVGIMTFLHNRNYGSLLQAWALQQAIGSLGVECEHMDYAPDRVEKLKNLLLSGNSPKLILEGIRKRSVSREQKGMQQRNAAFSDFRSSCLRLSPVCRNTRALDRTAAGYDVLLCGSDQIWSPVWMNPAYFLCFGGKKRRVAYAPSLGTKGIPSARKARRIRRLLRQFDVLSVREQEGAQTLKALCGREVPVMPDPVFLLSREQWLSFARKPEEQKGILLCYFIGQSDSYWTEVKRIAKEKQLTIRVIPVTAESFAQEADKADALSPAEWVGQIASAELLVTDSFHGAAFASLLGTECRILRRYRDDDPESKNSRIDQLQRSLGAKDGVLLPSAGADDALLGLRMKGITFLKESLCGDQ